MKKKIIFPIILLSITAFFVVLQTTDFGLMNIDVLKADSYNNVSVRGLIVPEQPAGTYNGPVLLKFLDLQKGSFLRYTTNAAATLTCRSGKKYADPIRIFKSVDMKVVVCDKNYQVQEAKTLSYVIEKCDYQKQLNPDGVRHKKKAQGCWSAKALDNSQADRWKVFRFAPPPTAVTKDRYIHHPTKDAVTQHKQVLVQEDGVHAWGVNKYAYVWVNRCHPTAGSIDGCGDSKHREGNPVFNTVDSTHYRAFFSTREKAHHCTIAQTQAIAGTHKQAVENRLLRYGLSMATNDAMLVASAQKFNTANDRIAWLGSQDLYGLYLAHPMNAKMPWIVDTCYVPELDDVDDTLRDLGSHVRGILFDWEVADRRTSHESIALMRAINREAKRHQPLETVFFTNDLRSPSIQYSGIDAVSAPVALDLFDYVSIWATPGWHCMFRPDGMINHLNDQLSIYGATGNALQKVFVLYDLLNDENHGVAVRNFIQKKNMAGVFLHRNNSIQDHCTLDDASPVAHIYDLLGMPEPQNP